MALTIITTTSNSSQVNLHLLPLVFATFQPRKYRRRRLLILRFSLQRPNIMILGYTHQESVKLLKLRGCQPPI